MAAEKVKRTATENLTEFRKLQDRLVFKYLQRNALKTNQVLFKGDAASAGEKQETQEVAKKLAEAKAAAEAKSMVKATQNQAMAAQSQQDPQKAQNNVKDKKTYDPVQILARVEKKNKEDEKQTKSTTILTGFSAMISSLQSKARSEGRINKIKFGFNKQA